MRSSRLDPLFAPLTALKGIGPAAASLFARLFGKENDVRIIDLLLHLPHRAVDRRLREGGINACQEGETVTVAVTIDRHRPAPPGKHAAPHRVYAHDATGDLILVWFGGHKARLEAMAPVGETRIVSGTIQLFDGMRQIVHPDHVLTWEAAAKLPQAEPVYPMVAGLGPGLIRRAIEQALARLPALPEWHPALPSVLPAFDQALRALHHPAEVATITPLSPAWQRLALDELLAHQLALALHRRELRRPAGRPTQAHGLLRERITQALPFTLTGSQQEAVAAILKDMASDDRMIRLLQGDVGSGKTLVALLAMAEAAEAGRQAALMAPTDILARQHAERLALFARAAGLEVGLLTGREKPKDREATLKALESGALKLVVGTHALIQESTRFHDLALAVVDEQHRFGVRQRQTLLDKGSGTDLLLMSATPIPRTLVMTYFGDTDVSVLADKPPGRKPIDTRVLPLGRITDVVQAVQRAVSRGERVYWICPLVAESETSELSAVTARFADLEPLFRGRIALLHGQMKTPERDTAMEAFRTGAASVLVATTVVEVGVDVPEASVMIIEEADRFGLAQLHQLRGRIGRGDKASTCLLLYREPLNAVAGERLKILRESEDGFVIAEADLALRGEGDLIGDAQSGLPTFRAARFPMHQEMLTLARDEAGRIMRDNPALTGEAGQALRDLLYLFDRAETLGLIRP